LNVVISEGFRKDLKSLSKEDRRHAWDAIDKLIESSNIHGGGLQMKKMKAFDIYEIRATLDLRILARRDGEDICCVRIGHHNKTLKAGADGRLGDLPDINRLRSLVSDTDLALAADEEVRRSTAGAFGNPSSTAAASLSVGPLSHLDDKYLRSHFGVAEEWIPTLRSLRTEEQFVAQELEDTISAPAWLELAEFFAPTPIVSTGAAPTYRVPSVDVARAFENGTIEELEFNLPASSWAVVERSRPGPIFVRGGPGSGKSLLGLYRALHALNRPPMLGRPTPRVLYATFTRTLAEDAREKAVLLRGMVPEGLEISTIDRLVERFAQNGLNTTYGEKLLVQLYRGAAASIPDAARFDGDFVKTEIEDVIVSRGLGSIDAYLSVSRTGRSRRLGQSDRRILWLVYERWAAMLVDQGLRTLGLARMTALDALKTLPESERFDLVVVDEVQDLTTTALGVAIGLADGTGAAPDVTLLGDGGQSIYRAGFKWADVGLRLGGGNVITLQNCERSTKQIMRFAAALAGRQGDEHDEDIAGTASRDGSLPRIWRDFVDREDQRAWIVEDIRRRLLEVTPRRLAVIARTKAELDRVHESLRTAKINCVYYGDADFHRSDAVRCVTAHSAKGLEFGDVYIIGADDGSFPLVYGDLSEDLRSEKLGIDARLLYVAVTRAKDRLTILCGMHPSPFLASATKHGDVQSISSTTL